MNKRIETLDFAKGFALFFMVVQHLSVWIGGGVGAKNIGFIRDNPIYFTAISFAALSAPIFVFSAGCGAKLFLQKYENSFKLVKRGLVLIAIGYILNIAVPSWFSPASWYVLHMIGFGLLTVPLLNKAGSKRLVILFFAVFLAAMTVQFFLNTPMHISNRWMGNMGLPLPFLRFAFVEGHFPILPWLSFFIFGFWSSEKIENRDYGQLLKTTLVLWLIGLVLVSLPYVISDIKGLDYLKRFYTVKVRFYPMLGPVFFLLTGALPVLMYVFAFLSGKSRILSSIFVPIGRISLTVFITHLFIKQFVHSVGIAESFGKWTTIGVTVLFLALYIYFEKIWRSRSYKYGFEWIMRKVA